MIEAGGNHGDPPEERGAEHKSIRETPFHSMPSVASEGGFGSEEKPGPQKIFASKKEQEPTSDIPEKGSRFKRFLEKITKQDPKENTEESKGCDIEISEETAAFDKSTFRLKGELERSDPTIEPLPPTPITDEAKERLKSWGVPEESITQLQSLTSSFRYDLIPQKAERIAQKGGYISEKPDGTEEVVLPEMRNFINRGDGQCSDLATQWVNLVYDSKYMRELNETPRGKGKSELNPIILSGNARTHFVETESGSAEHVWPGFLPMGESIKDVVAVDASFQEISNMDTNGYTAKGLVSSKTFEGADTALSFPVGTYTEKEGTSKAEIKGAQTLGVSADRKFAYELAFVKGDQDDIRPYVAAVFPDGRSSMQVTFNNSNELTFIDYTNDFPDKTFFTQEHKKEMERIVNVLKGIKFERK